MMLSGELDATIIYYGDGQPGRPLEPESATAIRTSRSCIPIRMPRACGSTRRHGIYPINHGVVVRREIAEKHPWVMINLIKAFKQANAIADARAAGACGLLPGDRHAAEGGGRS